MRKPPAEYAWRDVYMTADKVKECVSGWARASQFLPLREIGGIVDGRLDLLLVPLGIKSPMFMGMGKVVGRAWQVDWTERLGLVGVEVKVDRGDFLAGLNAGQFARYGQDLAGLYLAGPPEVVRLGDVPREYGVIHVGQTDPVNRLDHLVCRRHPKWKAQPPLSASRAWRVIWAMAKQIGQDHDLARRQEAAWEQKIRERAGRAIWAAVKECGA